MSVSSTPDPDKELFRWYIDSYHRSDAPETVADAKKAERLFKQFLQEKGVDIHEVDREVAFEFIDTIVEDYSANYQSTIIGEVQRFYAYCLDRGVERIDGNPIKVVLEDQDPLDKPKSRDPHLISIDEMSEFICSFEHPLHFGITTFLAKTTRRVGAVINLDLYDVNIDHPACDWDVHPDVRHRPDYIHVPAEPAEGEKFRGEVRNVGNKTESSRVIPIDNELKDALIWYLLIRPGANSKYSALWRGSFGERIKYDTLYKRVRNRAKELGHWYEPHDPHNVGLHYFRHWATTTIRDRSKGDTGLVDYIRGDRGQDVKDRYTHWSDAKEREYLDIVPKFF